MEEENSVNESQSYLSNFYIHRNVQEDIVNDGYCHVCFVEDSLEQNPIVFCDNCNIAVHKDCYYIDIIPEGNWYCDLCKYIMEHPGVEKPRCCICNKLVYIYCYYLLYNKYSLIKMHLSVQEMVVGVM